MGSIVQVADDSGRFRTLISTLKIAGLVDALEARGPFTLFAPVDAAFARLPAGTFHSLLTNPAALASVLVNHIIRGRIGTRDVDASGVHPRTLHGQSLDLGVRDGILRVNGARIVVADIAASNGVIHGVDEVLLPAVTPSPR